MGTGGPGSATLTSKANQVFQVICGWYESQKVAKDRFATDLNSGCAHVQLANLLSGNDES